MSNKPNESTLVAYFYGELENAERENVEHYLAQNPEERKRLEEWAFTRGVMKDLSDKEVIAPPIFLGEVAQERPFWKERYFRVTVGIAASMLFLLVAARILGLSASYSQGEMKIGFGARTVPAVEALTEERVNQMIEASLVSNAHRTEAAFNESRQAMEQSIRQNLGVNTARIDRYIQNTSAEDREQVKKFITQMQDDNLRLMKEYMQLSATGQKDYIETLMVDFSKYLQEQRKQDLQLFQVRLNTMEENTDQFKQETSQLLTSLISPGTSGTNSTRRN